MNYLTVENIAKSYGELTLFEGLSFSVHKDQKIAFVAKNGTGKTSILKMLAGFDVPDTGNIIYRKDIKVAFLPQEPILDPELTIEQTIFNADNPVLDITKKHYKILKMKMCIKKRLSKWIDTMLGILKHNTNKYFLN